MIKIYEFEKNYHFDLNVKDEDMEYYYRLSEILKEKSQFIERFNTFETPIYVYRYHGIEFELLFDEMIDEPFISVGKEYDYTKVVPLIQEAVDYLLTERGMQSQRSISYRRAGANINK